MLGGLKRTYARPGGHLCPSPFYCLPPFAAIAPSLCCRSVRRRMTLVLQELEGLRMQIQEYEDEPKVDDTILEAQVAWILRKYHVDNFSNFIEPPAKNKKDKKDKKEE